MISINALQNRSIAIFGTGKDAVKCAYNLCAQGISIESFLIITRRLIRLWDIRCMSQLQNI